MLRFSDILTIAAASALVTAGLATAEAHDIKIPPRASMPVMSTVAPAPLAPAIDATPARVQVLPATVDRIVAAPCDRKIKVVYAGYVENGLAGCARR